MYRFVERWEETPAAPFMPDTASGPATQGGPENVPLLAPPSRRPPKGTWLDAGLDIRAPEGGCLTIEVLIRIGEVEKRKRKRKRSDQSNHFKLVRTILANGLRCHFHRETPRVAYFRKADGYLDAPSWLSGKAMARTIDLMAKVGLLRNSTGERETSSTYEITEELIRLAEKCAVTENSLTMRLAPDRLIELRCEARGSDPIAFEPTPETRRWTGLLDAYNAFLVRQNIGLDLTPEEEAQWVAKLNKQRRDGTIPYRRPERLRTDLRRIFNNGSFDQGGRMYGGWWINVPKELRRKITINGQPTIELDYSGCLIRMLYHERGIDYLDDPYSLPKIEDWAEEQGLDRSHYREGIKAMVQAVINDRDGLKPERIPLPGGLSFRPRFKRRAVMQMIEDKHAPIADAFRTGAGLRLQRKESDLALSIITTLMDMKIIALPIHDSFITREGDSEKLSNIMNDLYKYGFIYRPIISGL